MSKIYCAAPWRGLHIQVDGGISTCCAGNFKLGNINTDTIESALSHEKLKGIRTKMKSGGLPEEYCKSCIQASRNKIDSERDWHNSLNKDFDLALADADYQFPVIFDARWNNTCNSACTYCSPVFSSKWSSIHNSQESKPVKDHKEKIKLFFAGNSNKLKTVAMVGGEPLLMKENADLLELIPDNVKVDVISNFSTDVTKSKVFEKLLKRPKVNWHISIENVGERYEYVRQGSHWQKLLDNLKILGAEVRNPPEVNDHEIQFMSLFHLLSATRLCEYKDFAKEVVSFFPHKFTGANHPQKNIEIVWQNFSEPKQLAVENYGADVLAIVIEEIQKYMQTDITAKEKQYFQSKILTFQQIKHPTSDQIKKDFASHVNRTENLFNKVGYLNRLWPEISFLTS
jgi:sulfatase maturation enzyme AslB (radical SAM superfamily)